MNGERPRCVVGIDDPLGNTTVVTFHTADSAMEHARREQRLNGRATVVVTRHRPGGRVVVLAVFPARTLSPRLAHDQGGESDER